MAGGGRRRGGGAQLAAQVAEAPSDCELTADSLWLATLNRITTLAAHEVRGALNGVSVNLEVVRSRAARADVPASNVERFAHAAADQLDAVITLTEALLALARPAREPVDVARAVGQLNALLAPAVRTNGRQLTVEGAFDDPSLTSAGGSAVRGAIGGCLLAAIEASADVRLHPAGGGSAPVIRIESCDGSTWMVGPDIIAVAAAAGIHIVAEMSAATISFPR
jgi:signal transduction histidine kinase